jgi:hypothetical protein
MSTSIIQTPVILKEEKDWQPWLELIKSASLKQGLWEYINPSTPWSQVPRLERPIRPTPSTVKPPTVHQNQEDIGSSSTQQSSLHFDPTDPPETKFSELDQDEKQHLQTLKEEYAYDLKSYDRKIEALAELRTRIQSTITKANFLYTTNCDHI